MNKRLLTYFYIVVGFGLMLAFQADEIVKGGDRHRLLPNKKKKEGQAFVDTSGALD